MARKRRRRAQALVVLILPMLLLIGWSAAQEPIQEVTIRAWTIGPEVTAYYRAENLVLAGERLNQILEDAGSNVRVRVEADFWTETWDTFRRRVVLTLEGGDPDTAPDIVNASHLDIPQWAETGWIIPLDPYIERYWNGTYQDVHPHLWDSVTFEGQRWAVPQDIEARLVWVRKDHLRSLGWSEQEIDDLPSRVARGEFLLSDLIEVAARMQEEGLVEWGIIHRPSVGPDFFQYIVAFGGEYYDPDSDKLVLQRDVMEKVLGFFHSLAQEHRITPPGMTTWPFPSVHGAIAKGETGFQITGGMWNWTGWQVEQGVTEEYLWENVGWTLIPAGVPEGRPNQLGHPLVYMVTEASKNKDLAALLITLASSVDLNTNHAVEGGKLNIRLSQAAFPTFAESEYLREISLLLPQQIFVPTHPGASLYNSIFYEAIGGVETGAISPSAAVDMMVQRLTRELGDEIDVR
jgi:inositol-phosphate transport system substrate-binding protein